MPACPECYSDRPRATPLLNARACPENHEQYVCGTCGRCICSPRSEPLIEHDKVCRAMHADIRMLSAEEVDRYLEEQAAPPVW